MTEMQGKEGRSGPGLGLGMGRRLVSIGYGGHRIGLHRVMLVGEVGMLLNHGGISFPVGKQFDVDQSFAPNSAPPRRPVAVADNTLGGPELTWRPVETGEM